MLKSIIKFLGLALYTVLVLSYCFFADKLLNVSLSSKMFFAHFYSFPALFGTIISGIAILFLIIGLARNKRKYLHNKRFLLPMAFIAISLVFVFFSSDTKRPVPIEGNKEPLKIVELNAQNIFNSSSVKKIFEEFDADITVLPEFGGYKKGESPAIRLFDLMEAEGIDTDIYDVFSSPETEGNIAPVTVVIKRNRLEYDKINNPVMTSFGTVYLSSGDKKLPNIIGLHTAPPLPGLMGMWNRDLQIITENIAANNKEAIILGDFNATGRHGLLNLIDSHEDAINYLPLFDRGTWGLFLLKPFRTSIDHIYIPQDKYLIKAVQLVEFNGPDHAGIFLELIMK